MSVAGQARSPQPDPKGLLVRQMTSHIPDPAANKLARIAWAVLARGRNYEPRITP